jgi:hypothetical protein
MFTAYSISSVIRGQHLQLSVLSYVHLIMSNSTHQQCALNFARRSMTKSYQLTYYYYLVYLTMLFQYLRLYSVKVGGQPAASEQFLLNPDSSATAI